MAGTREDPHPPRRARKSRTRKRVSQADVARAAGVSTGIVSSVINNKTYGSIRVGAATRQRVLDAISELGYVPDIAARSMAGGTNRILGVFTYDAVFPVGSQSFYHEFLVGIEEAADEAEQNLLLVTGARQEQRRSLYPSGVNGLRLADGGLLLGSREDEAEIHRLDREGFPFVFVGERHFAGVEPSFVAADYRGGTARLMAWIHAAGHERIAYLQSHDDPYPGRLAGFVDGRAQLGLSEGQCPVLPVARESDLPDDETAVAVLDSLQEHRITAALVQRGALAASLWREGRRRGLDMPADLSVISLTGDQQLVDGRELTELAIPRHGMGSEAVRILLQLIADPDAGPIQTWLDCGIREGETFARRS